MKAFKNNHSTCNNCFSAISTGQANATTYVFGLALCVHCSSNNNKFESLISNHMSLYTTAINMNSLTYAK